MNNNLTNEELKKMISDLLANAKISEVQIKEIAERFKETDVKFKETAERFIETDVKFKETAERFKETDRQIKENNQLFTTQWGKLIESLVSGDLLNHLKKRGIEVTAISERRKGTYQSDPYELDIIAHNGTEIVIVEVKSTMRVKSVRKHLRKLEKIKLWLPEYKNYKVYGSMAYLRAEEESEIFAQNKGLFVIQATGNSSIMLNKKNFRPKVF